VSDTLTVALIAATAAVAAPLLTLLGVWLERRVKHKTADAAVTTAEAAQETAEAAKDQAEAAKKTADASLVSAQAEMRRAVVAEREQANADWARFCNAQDRIIKSLSDRTEDNNRRLSEAEMRTEAAELRATQAEKLYAISIIYLRRLVDWINDNLPGQKYPPPPSGLKIDMGMDFDA
jgi:hypothetical protein